MRRIRQSPRAIRHVWPGPCFLDWLPAYQGRYRVTGDRIDDVDDTGFTADGEFRSGILYHAGMVLYARPLGPRAIGRSPFLG